MLGMERHAPAVCLGDCLRAGTIGSWGMLASQGSQLITPGTLRVAI
jgi:hypothetical protein